MSSTSECPVCKSFRIKGIIEVIDLWWHYGQVMPKKDRTKLAQAIKKLVLKEQTPEQTAKIIHGLLEKNQIFIRVVSKTKSIEYKPTLHVENDYEYVS